MESLRGRLFFFVSHLALFQNIRSCNKKHMAIGGFHGSSYPVGRRVCRKHSIQI